MASPFIENARNELQKGKWLDPNGEFKGKVGTAVLELLEAFEKQGHGSPAATAVTNLFERLVAKENLTPLTDDPAEWTKVEAELWQSKRNPNAYSKDKGKTYTLMGEHSQRDVHQSEKSGKG